MTLHLKLSTRVIVKKNSHRIFRTPGGKPFLVPSIAFEKFKAVSKPEIINQSYGVTFTNPVRISYTFFLKGKIDADLDNLIASINDVLADCHVLHNDDLVTEINARKISGCRDFETEIMIEGEV